MKKRKHLIISITAGILVGLTYYFCATSAKDAPTEMPGQTSVPMVRTDEADNSMGENPLPVEATPLPQASEAAELEATIDNSSAPTSEYWELVIDDRKIDVGMSVEESELDKRPGWMNTSALPGEGTTVILGHRNNSHLRVLENAEIGDVISLNVSGVNHSYTISEINIHEDSNYTIPTTEGNSLVLVTCYPFRYSGNAPGKAVVVAVG